MKIRMDRPASISKKLGDESEWQKFLRKRHRAEGDYYFFSLRMMSYGASSVFLTLFFLAKLTKNMNFHDQTLSLFYLLAILFVFFLVFSDVKRFNSKMRK